jgi:hypothetical protein
LLIVSQPSAKIYLAKTNPAKKSVLDQEKNAN